MPIAIVVVGVIIAIAAWNNSFPALASELETDIPGYMKWGFAIAVLLALGYIPGMKMPSRWLLALITLVYVATQWSAIQSAFSSLASTMQSGTATAQGSGSPTPTASYVASNAPNAATSTGSGATTGGTALASAGTVVTAAQNLAANPLNPNAYLGLAAGFGGLA
jgi:hypothetical protein